MNDTKEENNDLIHVLLPELDVYSVMREITESGCQEDPFYICDVSEIIRRHEDWQEKLPRVETHYAVKCNDSRVVLETLAALGTGFDCASKDEIRKVLSLGVHPSRIIFAHPMKKVSHLEYAVKNGVTTMTFDSENELHKIKKIYPNARLLLRIKYDDLSARYIFGQKFGCHHEDEALELLQLASFLDLTVVGVCFHIGSSSKDHSIYRNAIAAARTVFDKAATVGYNLKLVDIGGGFPGEKNKSFKEVASVINSALNDYFPDPSVKIISEPGRYYVNTAFSLASCIHSIKNIHQTDPVTGEKMKIWSYYVDVSVYGALIPVLFDEFYVIKRLNHDPNEKLRPSIIWGPTCDTFDKITDGVVMLPEMNVGDWVVFEEAGAYTLSISCEFNGFPTPKIHSVINEDGRLLLVEKEALHIVAKEGYLLYGTGIDNSTLKLTSGVPHPLPRDRFAVGNKREYFKIGLSGPNRHKTNYF